MSNTDGMISANNPPLLTLKGQISVHLLSGDTVEGKFATQDAYNVFITVDNEPLMIPRVQIKFIKGREGQQIEPDSSHDAFFETVPSLPESSPPVKSRDNTEAYSITDQSDAGDITIPLPSEIQSSSPISVADDSEDATDIFYRDKLPAAELDEDVDISVLHRDSQNTPAIDEIIEDLNGTVLLYPDAKETPVIDPGGEDDEDDGTLFLYPDADQFPMQGEEEEGEEEDGTVILFPPTVQPASTDDGGKDDFDDFDGTVILGPADIPGSQIASPGQDETDDDDDDMTMVMGQPEEPQPTASLTCIGGPHAGEVLQLTGGITTMGRSSDNVLVLSNDKEISRHHAIILQESGKYVVQDQNSLNGTFVNDEPVTTPRYLEHGDEILVGLSILKYEEI